MLHTKQNKLIFSFGILGIGYYATYFWQIDDGTTERLTSVSVTDEIGNGEDAIAIGHLGEGVLFLPSHSRRLENGARLGCR